MYRVIYFRPYISLMIVCLSTKSVIHQLHPSLSSFFNFFHALTWKITWEINKCREQITNLSKDNLAMILRSIILAFMYIFRFNSSDDSEHGCNVVVGESGNHHDNHHRGRDHLLGDGERPINSPHWCVALT